MAEVSRRPLADELGDDPEAGGIHETVSVGGLSRTLSRRSQSVGGLSRSGAETASD
jgi:hypothetical protein